MPCALDWRPGWQLRSPTWSSRALSLQIPDRLCAGSIKHLRSTNSYRTRAAVSAWVPQKPSKSVRRYIRELTTCNCVGFVTCKADAHSAHVLIEPSCNRPMSVPLEGLASLQYCNVAVPVHLLNLLITLSVDLYKSCHVIIICLSV